MIRKADLSDAIKIAEIDSNIFEDNLGLDVNFS